MKHLKIMLISAVFSTSAFASTHLAINGDSETSPATNRPALAVVSTNACNPLKGGDSKRATGRKQTGEAKKTATVKAASDAVAFLSNYYTSWDALEADAQRLIASGQQSSVDSRFSKELKICLYNGSQDSPKYWMSYMTTGAILTTLDQIFNEADLNQAILENMSSFILLLRDEKLTASEHDEAERLHLKTFELQMNPASLLRHLIMSKSIKTIDDWRCILTSDGCVEVVKSLLAEESTALDIGAMLDITRQILDLKLTPSEHTTAYNLYQLISEAKLLEVAFNNTDNSATTKKDLISSALSEDSTLSLDIRLNLVERLIQLGYGIQYNKEISKTLEVVESASDVSSEHRVRVEDLKTKLTTVG